VTVKRIPIIINECYWEYKGLKLHGLPTVNNTVLCNNLTIIFW
jgi:hypothetical protein